MTGTDACPGILDLHEARDGLLARIRLPGGYASGSRLRGLAALASQFGNGCVDLTARGNVQLRGVQASQAGELARRAASAGLLPSPAHDRARNITASPLAGLAGHPDLRWLVRALDRAVRADPLLAALPGRFVFCLDDGTGRAGLGTCDAGLRLHPPGSGGTGSGGTGRIGADLIVAGRVTGLHGPAARLVGHAIEVSQAFLGQRGAVPARTRVADLPDGGSMVAAALGGTLGERVADITSRLPLGAVVACESFAGAAGHPAGSAGPAAVVAAPLARLTAPQLRLVARMVRPGDAARLTAAGRIVLPLAVPVAAALPRLAGAGLLVSDDENLSAVTACSGLTCIRSLADVRSLATRVPGQPAVHWAGCGRRCGLPADAVAVIAESADQFTLADGTALRIPAASVPADSIPAAGVLTGSAGRE